MLAQATRTAARTPLSAALVAAGASAGSSTEASSSSRPSLSSRRAITTASSSEARSSRNATSSRNELASWSQTRPPSSLRQFHKSRASSSTARFADTHDASEQHQVSSSSSSSSSRSITPQPTTEALQRELQGTILPGLALPDRVALQMVTHESWDFGKSVNGHNRRLAFLGRRALQAFLVLFVDSFRSSPSTSAGSSTSAADAKQLQLLFAPAETTFVEEWLHTSALGQHAGASLRLERVMRWTPASAYRPRLSDDDSQADTNTASQGGGGGVRESGLYKIRGVCVEALVGALYHQHGAHVARLFFDSQILPTLRRATPKPTGRDSKRSARKGQQQAELGSWFGEAVERRAEEATGLLNMVIVSQQQQRQQRQQRQTGAAMAATTSDANQGQQIFPAADAQSTTTPTAAAAQAQTPARAFAFSTTDVEEAPVSRNVAYAVGA